MFLIKEMPFKERPRERFLRYGREALSTQELIAIILRTGTRQCSVLELSQRITCQYKTLKKLSQTNVRELTRSKGMGEAKAIQLLAALEIGRRLISESFPEQITLLSPDKVYEFMKTDLEMCTQETFHSLYLDTKGALIEKQKLFVGSLSSALVHPRELFKHAVTLSAASIVLVHNHPSGDPTPSESDRRITNVMVENGKLMDIAILDHIIIGKGEYFSFKARGEM